MTVYGMSDKAILAEIGRRLKRKRLSRNITQQHLGEIAGLERMTISAIENGNPFDVITLIKFLRALDSLEAIDDLLPDPGISPLQLAKLEGKTRQRASRKMNSPGQDI